MGNVVDAGGNASRVRPPGAAPARASRSARTHKDIAAFDATTGALLPFSHTSTAPNSPVPSGGADDATCSPGTAAGNCACETCDEIHVSADPSTLDVDGDFMTVDGVARDRWLPAAARTAPGPSA